MNKIRMKDISTFAALCTAKGKNEKDYDVEAAATNAMKAFICLNRLKLIASGYNGNKKPAMADVNQRKYYAWVDIIQDTSCSGGFRLSFYVCGFGTSLAALGARPYFLDPNDVEEAFNQWEAEFTRWAQYESLSLQEE